MEIELQANEATVVKNAIDTRIHEMQSELVRTHDRAYRAGLKAEMEVLERFERRLVQEMSSRFFTPHI